MGEIKENIKTIERKIENTVEGNNTTLFSLRSKSKMVFESSLLKLTEAFIPVCKVDTSLTKWSGYHNSRLIFKSASLLAVSKALWSWKISSREACIPYNAFLLYYIIVNALGIRLCIQSKFQRREGNLRELWRSTLHIYSFHGEIFVEPDLFLQDVPRRFPVHSVEVIC